jgi:hypothetical protein
MNNNGCLGSNLVNFPNNYNYKPITYPLDENCPTGYSKMGSSCMKTLNKTSNTPEAYDELNEQILLFDVNKKLTSDYDAITKNIPVDKYIVKKCPLKNPNDQEQLLNKDESEKTRTTTEITCKYETKKSRDINTKSDCFSDCDPGFEEIQCGSDSTNVLKDYKNCYKSQFGLAANDPWRPNSDNCPSGWTNVGVSGAVGTCTKNCPPGYNPSGVATCQADTYGRGFGYAIWDEDKCNRENGSCEKCLAMWYPRCRPGYTNAGCNICQKEGPSTIGREQQGIWNCRIRFGLEGVINTIGNVVRANPNATDNLGPLLCGRNCPPGFIVDPTNKFVCKKTSEIKLCYPERKIDMDAPDKTWVNYCASGNSVSSGVCFNAIKSKKLNENDFDSIYKNKCLSKLNQNDLVETTIDDIKVKNKLEYKLVAQKCFEINKDATLQNLTPNSFYKLDIALPLLNVSKNNNLLYFSKTDDLREAFERLDLIIDNNILRALNTSEFTYKLEETECDDKVKAYKITFVRSKYGSTDEDCCLNLENGLAKNYYQSISNDLINPDEANKVYFSENLLGAKTSCDPKLKKIEGGNDICRTSLNEFCADIENGITPRMVEFTDETQKELKHKRCDIDFQKKYKSDYDKTLKSICNDYDSGFSDIKNKKDLLISNKKCIDYCAVDMTRCDKGMKKYCTQKHGDTNNPKVNLFNKDCQDYLTKQPDYDIILERMCVLDKLSPVYNDEKCKVFRNQYEKCLINDNYKGSNECKEFYRNNKNITTTLFNKECDANPSLKHCDNKIIQKDIYKNEYEASPNEREAAKAIINSDQNRYFKTSEENLLKTQPLNIKKNINAEQISYCLNKSDTLECKKLIDEYIRGDFIDMCIKSRKDAFENVEICKNIKANKNIDYMKSISKYCDDRESAVYELAECAQVREDNKTKSIIIKGIIFTIIIIIILIIVGYIRKK